MATTIKLKNSVTTTNAPSSLVQGEVAINITDKKVWVGNAATTPIQLLGDGGSASFTSLSLSGNLTFTGTGNRITGDFSNATVANRVLLQTSTTNGNTNLTLIPNGTSVVSTLNVSNGTDPDNSALGQLRINSTVVGLDSTITGTGTYLPLTIRTGGSERLRIDTSGNVGIGSTNPYSLSSYRTVDIDGASGGLIALRQSGTVYSLIYANSGQTVIQSNTAIPMLFNVNGSERMRIDTSGNVGIGTSSPAVRLDVAGTTNIRHTYTGATGGILFGQYDATGNAQIQNQSANGIIALATNNTERMRIDSSGNVGIGVTPSAWGSADKAIQVGAYTSLANDGNGSLALTSNAYESATNTWRYIASLGASRYRQNFGDHAWFTAPSGTAGNTITWTQAMTLDSSGNVGIGSTSPLSKLEVVGGQFRVANTSTAAVCIISTDSTSTNGVTVESSYYGGAGYGPMKFNTGGSERMRITSSGLVGIGSTNPDQMLVIRKDSASTISGEYPVIDLRNDNASGFNQLRYMNGTTEVASILASNADSSLRFRTNSSVERMRITSGGALLVGTTNVSASAGAGFKIINSSEGVVVVTAESTNGGRTTYELYSTGAGAYRFYVGAGGTIFATSTTISAISDERLKENIRDLDVGIDAIMAVKPRKFDWKEGKGLNKKDDFGFVAQEFETVFPNSVTTSKAGADGIEYKTVNHSELIPTLVKAIQEQQAMIEELKQEVAKLKGV